MDSVLKGGSLPSALVVRQPGGEVNGEGEYYPGTGSFSDGEHVLLMLTPASGGVYELTDYALGKFHIGRTSTGTEFLRREGYVVRGSNAPLTTDALRAAYNAVRPKVSDLYSSIPLDAKLYARLRAFADTEEAKHLTPTRRRFLDKTLRDFRRHGAELDEAGKAKLRELVNPPDPSP